MKIDKIKLNNEQLGFFRFGKLNKKYLLTNETGEHLFLKPELFKKFLEGKISKKTKIYKELLDKGLIKSESNIPSLISKYREKNLFLFKAPSLHIIVVTLRCNHKCIYCQASSRGMEEKKYDMSISTAKKVVDTIFSSPGQLLSIEFQGGEPLANWKTVKFIIEYAIKKSIKTKKRLIMPLVTNLSLMDEKKYNFLIKHNVKICTSLDGPEELHNKNRIYQEGNSYQETIKWIKKAEDRKKNNPRLRINALTTISKYSLKYPKEIVDEYIKWNIDDIHLRPLSFLGFSGKMQSTIGYSAQEFFIFWKKAMDYIIKKNLQGKIFSERGSRIILEKILTPQNPGFLDLRSPCGAGIGQLLYDYDGKVYTCDEGRMTGDDTFMIGNVNKDNYKKIISHPTIKTMCMASLLEDLPCDKCVYKPYCGVCPVQNYVLYKNIFPQLKKNERCVLHKKIFDYLFEKMENKRIKKVFRQWIR